MDTTKEIAQPLVSILMLTYNRAHFLPEAIESILNQTYQNWELVVIDDGSKDNTKELMASYTDPRIHYLRYETNAGLFARRTESLTYAKGSYTAILDSDDYWPSHNKLAEQVAFLEANLEHALVGTQTILVDDSGTTIGQCTYNTTDTDIRKKILLRNQFTHSGLLIRSVLLQKTKGYQPILAEDLELVLQLGMHGKLANLPHFYTAHRVHQNSENDHGPLMAGAVVQIVSLHAKEYPNASLAKLISRIRLALYGLKSSFK